MLQTEYYGACANCGDQVYDRKWAGYCSHSCYLHAEFKAENIAVALTHKKETEEKTIPNWARTLAEPVLPEDAEERKRAPIFSGVLDYFPLALAAVARVSKRGNDQHNPGDALHWARGKSMDHMDCIIRHSIDVETVDSETGEYRHAEALAWRGLAKLQELEEKRLGKPMSRGSRNKP